MRKYYSILLKRLPSDYMVTLGRLCKAIPVNDQTVDDIITSTDSSVGNMKILHHLILKTENDNGLLDFCNAVEKILPDVPTVLGPLRNGNYIRSYTQYCVLFSFVVLIYSK